MSLRSKFFKWLTHGQLQVNPVTPETQSPYTLQSSQPIPFAYATGKNEVSEEQPNISLKFIKAENGRVVEVSSFDKNKHGHFDRAVETYVVTEDQKLSDVILQILAIKALEK
jgi:hypothetical protein